MTIQAQLADGRTLEFPDGTDPQVIQATVKKMVAQAQIEPPQPAQQPVPQPAQQQTIEQPEQQASQMETGSGGIIGGINSAILDPAMQMVGSLGGLAVGGVETLAKAPFIGLDKAIEQGQQTTQSISNSGLFAPKTQAGEVTTDLTNQALSSLGKIPAGWAGIGNLLAGNGIEQSAEAVKKVEEVGIPRFMGDLVMDKTGSPFLATMTVAAPEIAALLFTHKSFGNRAKTIKAENELNLIEKIKSGDPSSDLAKYKLTNREKWQTPTKQEVNLISKKLDIDKDFAQAVAEGVPKLELKKTYSAVMKQEWDEGLLGLIEASSKTDKTVYQRMLDIYEKGASNPEFKAKNRPIFEAGKTVSDEIKFLLAKKNEAGKKVGKAAEGLRGEKVDFQQTLDGFIERLEADGVVFNKNDAITNVKQYGDIDFRNSPYDGSKASEDLLRNTIQRMATKDFNIDGFRLHNLKKNLPHKISTAKKSDGGLVNKAELELNELRRNVNDLLREKSPEYKQANSDFAEIITPLNKFNDTLPKNSKIDWEGVNPDKAGLQTRKILSNYSNAVDMSDALTGMNELSIKLGRPATGDAIKQTIFAINLDKRLGAFADSTFQGLNQAASNNVIGSLPTSTLDLGMKAVGGVMRKLKSVDNKQAIQAMKNYLKESKGKK